MTHKPSEALKEVQDALELAKEWISEYRSQDENPIPSIGDILDMEKIDQALTGLPALIAEVEDMERELASRPEHIGEANEKVGGPDVEGLVAKVEAAVLAEKEMLALPDWKRIGNCVLDSAMLRIRRAMTDCESMEARQQVGGWRDISTAPKDGRGSLLFWLEDEGFAVKARWTKPPLNEKAEECWWCYEMDCVLDLCGNATHWRHMPIGPSTTQEK